MVKQVCLRQLWMFLLCRMAAPEAVLRPQRRGGRIAGVVPKIRRAPSARSDGRAFEARHLLKSRSVIFRFRRPVQDH